MGIFPHDLEQIYDIVTEQKLRQRRQHQNSPKTRWNNVKWYPSHSMSVLE